VFLQALLAFLALPGLVAVVGPTVVLGATGNTGLVHPWGLLFLLVGFALLLRCVRDFYVSGKGTLAPWAPPKHLVVDGPYRVTRNPMYVAVTLILLGWAVVFASLGMLFYCVAMFVAFDLWVRRYEELFLARVHGAEWEEYCRRVRRW
jgi:protein-S-isoprenylcysteine O-methyltransferase Ste14